MAEIDYYFTVISPWAYLGHEAVYDMASRHGAIVHPKPMPLAEVFPETGGLPLAKRHPARQAYRLVELPRWRDFRGQDLNLRPQHFPVDPTLFDCVVIAAAESGGDVRDLTLRGFRAVWAEDRDVSDRATIAAIAAEAGLDGAALIERADDPVIRARYTANARDAVATGVVGSPGYVLNGEPFWGQDRIELVDAALRSGRAPYRIEGMTS